MTNLSVKEIEEALCEVTNGCLESSTAEYVAGEAWRSPPICHGTHQFAFARRSCCIRILPV